MPRPLALLGLIAGPVLLVGNLGVLFDLWEITGAVALLVSPRVRVGVAARDLRGSLGSGVTPRSFRLARVDALGGKIGPSSSTQAVTPSTDAARDLSTTGSGTCHVSCSRRVI